MDWDEAAADERSGRFLGLRAKQWVVLGLAVLAFNAVVTTKMACSDYVRDRSLDSTVDGRVIVSGEESREGYVSRTKYVLKARYVVDGRKHTIDYTSDNGQEPGREILDQHPVGSSIPVFYDSRNPESASFRRISWWKRGSVTAATIFLLATGLSITYVVRRKRGARREGQT